MSAAHTRTPSALRYPAFTRFLVARFLSTFAVQMQSVAIGWQVYAMTRDPLDLGLIGLAQFLPFLAVVLPAGQIADRHDRRKQKRNAQPSHRRRSATRTCNARTPSRHPIFLPCARDRGSKRTGTS